MFSGYFTNYPIFHYVIKSPGGSTEGYHSPHLPHSLKAYCTLCRVGDQLFSEAELRAGHLQSFVRVQKNGRGS